MLGFGNVHHRMNKKEAYVLNQLLKIIEETSSYKTI